MVIALAVLWLTFNLLSDGLFLTPRILWNLSVQSAAVAVMTTGMVLIIVSRNIDLSIGSVLGFTAMVMGLLQAEWLPDIFGLGLNQPGTWIIVVIVGIAAWRADRRAPGIRHRVSSGSPRSSSPSAACSSGVARPSRSRAAGRSPRSTPRSSSSAAGRRGRSARP